MVDLTKSIIKEVCKHCIAYDGKDAPCQDDYSECECNVGVVADGIKSWLSSFNTDSATVCFTAIQELKKAVNEDDNR